VRCDAVMLFLGATYPLPMLLSWLVGHSGGLCFAPPIS
jgi:hypothetical protein